MSKSALVRHVTGEAGLIRPSAEATVNFILPSIIGPLVRKDADSLLGFGTLAAPCGLEGAACHPLNGQIISVAASTAVAYKSRKALGHTLNAHVAPRGTAVSKRATGVTANKAVFSHWTANPNQNLHYDESSGKAT